MLVPRKKVTVPFNICGQAVRGTADWQSALRCSLRYGAVCATVQSALRVAERENWRSAAWKIELFSLTRILI